MGIIEAIIGIVAVSAIGAVGGGAVGLSLMGTALVAGVVYGGNAISKSLSSKKESYTNSPTYQFSALQTQTNNQLPIPIMYGENKIAGNRLWQQYRNNNTIIDRIIAFAEGPIESISEIKLNNIDATSLSGISYSLYTGLPGQRIDPVVPGDLTTKIKTVGSLKNLAYIAISVTASDKIRGDYNLTAVAKGRRVRIYTDPTTYTVKYSNNPAWCLLDFLTCYNGCGIGLTDLGARDDAKIADMIDINSFIEAAAFCDETVNGAPRFTFNMIIDSQSQRREIIEEFKKACRGALTLKGKQLQLKIDTPQTPVKSIQSGDIIAGSEQFYTISQDENYDRIIVKYRAKDQEWAICEAIAEKPQYDNIPPVEHSVNIYSVIDHDQASRLAWYYLNKTAREKAFGYFETDYRAFDLEIGDLIEFSDNLMKYDAKQVKITKLTDKNNGSFGVSWREYDAAVYSDAEGSLPPVTTLGEAGGDYGTPPDVANFCAAIILNTVNLNWTGFSDSSITYEIRQGTSWDSSQQIATNIGSTSIYVPITATGVKKYFIKAKSKYNFYSENASMAVIYVDAIPNVNTILHQNMFEQNIGTFVSSKIYQKTLKPVSRGYWTKPMPKTPQAPFADANGAYAECTPDAYSAFTTRIFDIQENLTSLLSLTAQFLNTDSFQTYSAKIRTCSDGLNWSDWKDFSDGSYTFRFYQMQFEVQNPHNQPWALYDTVLAIDVPDRDETYYSIPVTDTTNGTTIVFAANDQSKLKKDFLDTPSIVANVNGTTVGYCVITQKSPQSCTVRIFNGTNTPIAATCDIHVKGY